MGNPIHTTSDNFWACVLIFLWFIFMIIAVLWMPFFWIKEQAIKLYYRIKNKNYQYNYYPKKRNK